MNSAIGLVKSFINLLYPLHCASCGKHLDSTNSSGACDICISGIRRNPAPYCRTCGRSWSGHFSEMPDHPMSPTQEMPGDVDRCPECSKMDPYFSSAHSACLYEGSLKEFIHKFKYNNRQALSGPLTAIMLDYIRDNAGIVDGVDAITFIPLHRKKALERAFNQSETLAALIGKELAIPLIGCLEKRIVTKNQNELSREDRLVNVKNAFRIIPEYEDAVNARTVLVIDDVMTTGATLNEASRVLMEAGTANVRCLTLARGI